MNDRTRLPLPEGYEPHEIPPDYTGKLWIEGQMRAYADAENTVAATHSSLIFAAPTATATSRCRLSNFGEPND